MFLKALFPSLCRILPSLFFFISVPADSPKSRLAYIDWMRGLACLLMFQTHCYDSWLGGAARHSKFLMYSQLGGTFPAPLFLFLAGISFALVTGKLRDKDVPPAAIARTTIRRGAEIFGLGLLFRVQEFLIALGWAPWSDLLRVDVLNTIGLSMMLMGLICWLVLSLQQGPHARMALVLAGLGMASLIAVLTPPMWTTWRLRWLPWPVESYLNGVHNLGTPQAWLFPIFPWTAFAFAGLAVGFVLQASWTRAHEVRVFFSLGAAGILLVELARWLDRRPTQLYAVYDYWHTSPDFFFARLGLLLLILCGSYAWVRWGAGRWSFSPLILLGQASLLVYWIHIEFVYGRFSILPRRTVDVRTASLGLMIIFLAMLALAWARTRTKGRGARVLASLRPRSASAN